MHWGPRWQCDGRSDTALRPADLHCELAARILHARITGEIDMSNAGELADALTQAMTNEAFGIVLDLDEIEYIDSAGIQLIYRLRDTLHLRGQRLAVVVPPDSIVNEALRLAGVEHLANVVRTVEEALRLVDPGQSTSPRVNK